MSDRAAATVGHEKADLAPARTGNPDGTNHDEHQPGMKGKGGERAVAVLICVKMHRTAFRVGVRQHAVPLFRRDGAKGRFRIGERGCGDLVVVLDRLEKPRRGAHIRVPDTLSNAAPTVHHAAENDGDREQAERDEKGR